MLLVTAVRRALAELTIAPADRAAAELALEYARRIDGARPDTGEGERTPGDLAKLGPPLLAALEALGMTPRARAASVKGAGGEQQPERKPANPLDELRQRREQRAAG